MLRLPARFLLDPEPARLIQARVEFPLVDIEAGADTNQDGGQ